MLVAFAEVARARASSPFSHRAYFHPEVDFAVGGNHINAVRREGNPKNVFYFGAEHTVLHCVHYPRRSAMLPHGQA